MHQAPTYLRQQLFPDNTPIQTVIKTPLNRDQATQIHNRLYHDASSYIYSATVTMADAIQGIRQKFFTWATVKLYYATFYACRAHLALDDICIFYVGPKPFSLEVRSGNRPQKKEGQTHKVVLDAFRRQGVIPLLISQEIEGDDPLTWLMAKREAANYKVAKFQDPEVPEHFQKIVNLGLRSALKSYLQDESDLYLFDADHAIVAYPLKTLQYLRQNQNF